MKIIHFITLLFVLLGGLHVGLHGLTGTDLLGSMFGTTGFLNFVYGLVTLSTLYHIVPVLMEYMGTTTETTTS